MAKDPRDEILDAEVVEELSTPTIPTEERTGSQKSPKGTRKKDYPRFTPQVRETLLNTMALVGRASYAANLAGISEGTLYRWLERGRIAFNRIEEGAEEELSEVEKEFATFYVNFNSVFSKTVTALAGGITVKARKDPYLALKWLAKLDPNEFGTRQTIDMNVAGKVGVGHIHLDARQLTDGGVVAKQLTTDELRAMRAQLVERKSSKLLPEKSEDAEEESVGVVVDST